MLSSGADGEGPAIAAAKPVMTRRMGCEMGSPYSWASTRLPARPQCRPRYTRRQTRRIRSMAARELAARGTATSAASTDSARTRLVMGPPQCGKRRARLAPGSVRGGKSPARRERHAGHLPRRRADVSCTLEQLMAGYGLLGDGRTRIRSPPATVSPAEASCGEHGGLSSRGSTGRRVTVGATL
jgi:hypothetical protein